MKIVCRSVSRESYYETEKYFLSSMGKLSGKFSSLIVLVLPCFFLRWNYRNEIRICGNNFSKGFVYHLQCQFDYRAKIFYCHIWISQTVKSLLSKQHKSPPIEVAEKYKMAEELDGNTILARSLKEQVIKLYQIFWLLSNVMPFYPWFQSTTNLCWF